jgi:hypothetical protein
MTVSTVELFSHALGFPVTFTMLLPDSPSLLSGSRTDTFNQWGSNRAWRAMPLQGSPFGSPSLLSGEGAGGEVKQKLSVPELLSGEGVRG